MLRPYGRRPALRLLPLRGAGEACLHALSSRALACFAHRATDDSVGRAENACATLPRISMSQSTYRRASVLCRGVSSALHAIQGQSPNGRELALATVRSERVTTVGDPSFVGALPDMLAPTTGIFDRRDLAGDDRLTPDKSSDTAPAAHRIAHLEFARILLERWLGGNNRTRLDSSEK